MKICFILTFTFLNLLCFGQSNTKDSIIERKEYTTTFTKSIPKIDGELNDEAWKDVKIISDFNQNYPLYGIAPSQRTEVKIIYDNTALYISAKLYDNQPDSIAKQLGSRDNDLIADQFRLVFDTYNTQQDAFDFTVTASGVQGDSRFSDGNFNAVWESKTKITSEGWTVEIKIPYSALRFPVTDEHIWGFQITRKTIRNGKFDQWALTPRGVNNPLKYWGILKGINNIKAPVRLSLTPFITGVASHYPANIEGESNFTQKMVGGMDLKYGLNESYTLDVSLLPDFSQVQSDNLVKNLGSLEQTYDEQRPFFQENTDLFNKGNLFYSRRIGRKPSDYYSVYDNLNAGEKVITNPSNAKLLNIAKVSGRSKKGLGLGLMNAVLNNTYAIVRDSLGNDRKVLTEPFSNYNIAVIDQQLKNSSNVYLINSNVTRNQGYQISNVTGFGGMLNNKNNTYVLFGDGALTNIFIADSNNVYKNNFGHSYNIGFAKSSGKFTYSISSNGISPTFNNNDMGVTRQRNYLVNQLNLNYNEYVPFGKFINENINMNFSHEINYTTHTLNQVNIGTYISGTFKNFVGLSYSFNASPLGEVDYYEPRTAGRYFRRTPNIFNQFSFDSDYRKKLRVSVNAYGGSTALVSPSIGYNPFFGFDISPSVRVNDKLTFRITGSYFEDDKDRGFVADDTTNGDIIFGVRYLKNISYDFTVQYTFKNNLSLSLVGRHYWVRGRYVSFHNLSADGLLLDETLYNENHDFSFNAFNVNMLFQWQFAPGSFATLSWKNSINSDSQVIINNFGKNLVGTFASDQLNTISLRVVYYFDFLYLRKKRLAKAI